MFQVLYYPIGDSCKIKTGFSSRESAWAWVESQLANIDWYKIELID